MRRFWPFLCAVLLAACESQPPLPKNAGIGTTGLARRPVMLPPSAPPVIQAMEFTNGLDIATKSGSPYTRAFLGTIYTSSNVASVELRTNLFSINAAKKGVGRFDVSVDAYDLPSIFLRPYTLRVIARNTAGVEAEEDLPFRIR